MDFGCFFLFVLFNESVFWVRTLLGPRISYNLKNYNFEKLYELQVKCNTDFDIFLVEQTFRCNDKTKSHWMFGHLWNTCMCVYVNIYVYGYIYKYTYIYIYIIYIRIYNV